MFACQDDRPNLEDVCRDNWPNLAGTTATCFPVLFHAPSFTYKHTDLNTFSISSLPHFVHSKLHNV